VDQRAEQIHDLPAGPGVGCSVVAITAAVVGGARDRHPLLLPAGQLVRPLSRVNAQPDSSQQHVTRSSHGGGHLASHQPRCSAADRSG
jgi:hypothetical protein